VLAPALRLLVVDACAGQRRVAELTALLERSASLTATYVELDRIDGVPASAVFEFVWLFVDDKSDHAYCGLYKSELRERFRGAAIETVGIGELESSGCDVTLTPAMAGGAPPWRRKRELGLGASRLAEMIER
jgi:hypothetical protein